MRWIFLLLSLLVNTAYSQSWNDYLLDPNQLMQTRKACLATPDKVTPSQCSESLKAQQQLAQWLLLIKTNPQNFGKLVLDNQMRLAEVESALAKSNDNAEQLRQQLEQYKLRQRQYYVILRMISWTQ